MPRNVLLYHLKQCCIVLYCYAERGPLMGAPIIIQAHLNTIPNTGMTLFILELFLVNYRVVSY